MPGRKRKYSSEQHTSRNSKRRHGFSSSLEAVKETTPTASAEGEYWAIKDIIDENRTHYLVDWEDDQRTGEVFSPSWVCLFPIFCSSAHLLSDGGIKVLESWLEFQSYAPIVSGL